MRIISEPKVYLINRPSLVREGWESFLRDHNLTWPTDTSEARDAEVLVETAGRICYMSFGKNSRSKSNRSYINNLLGRNEDGTFREGQPHGSVLEHAGWSFLITGAGRGVSHEVVRHRVGTAISQVSTRYVDFGEAGEYDPGFVLPPGMSEFAGLNLTAMLTESERMYRDLLKVIRDELSSPEKQEALSHVPERDRARMIRKAAQGIAREILPTATEAIMVWSANARAIWNTISLRGSEHAEGAIRGVFVQIARLMETEMPAVFGNLRYGTAWDGTETVTLPRDKI